MLLDGLGFHEVVLNPVESYGIHHMESHGILWNCMQCNCMGLHGTLWNPMESYGRRGRRVGPGATCTDAHLQFITVGLLYFGILWNCCGILCNPIGLYGIA